jgi:hypothetical protein
MTGVLDVVKPIQHYIKFPQIWIDNIIFRLHAKVQYVRVHVVRVLTYTVFATFRKVNLLS